MYQVVKNWGIAAYAVGGGCMDDVRPQQSVQPTTHHPSLPPLSYLPAQQGTSDDAEARLELRRLVDGRLAAMAYSTLERLVQSCGEAQPWVLLPTPVLEEYRERLGIE